MSDYITIYLVTDRFGQGSRNPRFFFLQLGQATQAAKALAREHFTDEKIEVFEMTETIELVTDSQEPKFWTYGVRQRPGRNLTITVLGIPDKLFKTLWDAAVQNAPTKILNDPRGEKILFDVPQMDNKLARPLAEMLTLATSMAAIEQYQKEKN